MPRASGKTTLLIKESAKSQKPIIVGSEFAVQCIIDQANEMGEYIPKPINVFRYMNSWDYRHDVNCGMNRYSWLLIDELDDVLKQIFGKPIDKVTYTPKEMEYKNGGYLDMNFGNTTNAGWYGFGGIEFSDDGTKMRASGSLRDDIYDINVIVPDKVVEITFGDGKEKMVCHDDDTFDLRKCCFIAIAKHLYKKEYTQEGIEYMATQLTYQKKYVKIVDKALKEYKRKEEEKAEKIRKEEEEKIIRERQSIKRRKQKERRAQRHREALIDVFADSINEAKKRRKANKF